MQNSDSVCFFLGNDDNTCFVYYGEKYRTRIKKFANYTFLHNRHHSNKFLQISSTDKYVAEKTQKEKILKLTKILENF